MSQFDEPVCPSCGVAWAAHLGIQLTCHRLGMLREANKRLEDEVVQLYAALKATTKQNLEMRKQLESWADQAMEGRN